MVNYETSLYMWSTPAVWKQYNKMAVLHFFLVNSSLYILFYMMLSLLAIIFFLGGNFPLNKHPGGGDLLFPVVWLATLIIVYIINHPETSDFWETVIWRIHFFSVYGTEWRFKKYKNVLNLDLELEVTFYFYKIIYKTCVTDVHICQN